MVANFENWLFSNLFRIVETVNDNVQPVTVVPKVANPDVKNIGRNDPCWCGSGKKYKKCHGK
ncbi:MAG: SEC-C metal-binding domain-containing protein [Patescibacteria group bacterium]|nr:SEC-C metal-binding domain-containing protein [Patescibacteria group bacterium]